MLASSMLPDSDLPSEQSNGTGTQFSEGSFSSPCPGCGSYHANFDGSDFGPLSFLNADDRGGSASNKPSLTISGAAAQISRTGQSWATSGLGTAGTVTFAFRSTAPSTMPSDTAGFTRFTEVQISAALNSLKAWSDVANITFTRVSDADGYSDSASILFGDYASGATGSAAFAYFPGNRSASSASGDVWVYYSGTNTSPSLLNYGQHTLTHEIGHAIGLSHPAAYNAEDGVTITYGTDATYYEDSRQYTVMSYFSETNTGANYRSGGVSQYSAVPLLDDIAAAQRLYGANLTTRTGNTIYGFNSNADRAWFSATSASTSLIFAVWDAGGTDTFDFSGYSQSQTIDLRQGAFSSVGGLVGNIAIAAGVVIENAIGGAGSDTIRGNSADNRLAGNGGTDSIDGGLGTDTVVFTGARSAYGIMWTGQTGRIVGNGQDVTVTNVEFLAFTDQTIAATPSGGINVSGDLTNDTINGTAFVDTLSGGGGDDVLNGLAGTDNLFGQAGNDILNGGDGDDFLFGGLGDDVMDGGSGTDMADYLNAANGVTVDLLNGVATGVGTDALRNIEIVRGSSFSDLLRGDAAANELRGSGGADIMYGGDGNDRFYSGVAGLSGGAPDVLKPASGINTSRAAAVQLDGSFDLLNRTDVANASSVAHATVVSTSGGGAEWYTFTATAGVAVVLDIDNATFDSVVRIYNLNGDLLATNDDGSTSGDAGNSTDSALTFTVPSGGVYYIEVTEWVSNDPELTTKSITAGATYTLHVSVPSHDVASTEHVGSVMYGEGGDDVFYQGFNVDTINMGSANDTMDGGDGVDTVSYNGVSTEFTVTTANGVTTVRSANWGTDTLRSIERIQFNDRLLTPGVSDAVSGTANGDKLVGTSGADVIYGLGGDDRITSLGGTDYIDGGDGFDTAIYSGLQRGYSASSARVSGGHDGGTDTLVSIEEASFLDGRLSFDQSGNAAAIVRLYDATFDRPADNAGMNNWLAALGRGLTLKDVAIAFSQSGEFTSRYAGTSNDQFVREMYRFSLGREGDASGIAGWVDHLASGRLTRAEVLLQFSESAEHKAQLADTVNAGVWIQDETTLSIARLYHGVLDRLPDEGGLTNWRAAATNGATLEGIAAAFMGSAEFTIRFGSLSNQQFVEQLYRFTLDREGDAAGIAGWVANLNNGVSRARVVLEFSESPEHIGLTRPFMENGVVYEGYTGHPATGIAEAAAFAAAIDEPGAAQTLPVLTSSVLAIDKHGSATHDDAAIGEALTLLIQSVGTSEAQPMVQTMATYDPADIVIGFKDASHDPFVLPVSTEDAGAALIQHEATVDDALSAPKGGFGATNFGGQGAPHLTLLPDNTLVAQDHDAPWTRLHLHDQWA